MEGLEGGGGESWDELGVIFLSMKRDPRQGEASYSWEVGGRGGNLQCILYKFPETRHKCKLFA